jgi:N-carbamoylputrescine amidase
MSDGSSGSTRTLRVAVVQTGNVPEDHTLAVDQLLALFEEKAAPDVDLVVFPELATTPYFCGTTDDSYKSWAQTIPGPDTERFAALARRLDTAVVFGMFELADGVGYNSGVMIDRYGDLVPGTTLAGDTVAAYRKTSIPMNDVSGTPVNEKHFFEPGTGPVVFDALGTRFAMLICYDRTFPEYWLAARSAGAEVVLVLVSSLGFRETLFTQELQVRGLETQVWVVAPNRGGAETLGGRTTSYFGRSCVVAPDGSLVAVAAPHSDNESFTVDLDLDRVAEARSALPLQRDRMPAVFEYLARSSVPA